MRRLLCACLCGVLGVAMGQAQAAPAAAPSSDQAARREAIQQRLADWPQLDHYRAANAALAPVAAGEQRVVFYGASVAEYWGKNGSVFFPGKPYINRGIGGQISSQLLLRFRQDVIDLHPAAVVILEGTNDISNSKLTPEMTENNWESMVDLAKANGIRVVLTSITPVSDFPWHRGMHPAGIIRTTNAWLKAYCANHSLVYVDFYSVLVNSEGGMKADLTVDGVHATPKGYAVMAPLVQAGIDEALGKKE
ncbi:lipase [Edaphobacter acidisoli]|uniref:Lipase n=1 Tax=Edaphobacter acidisoli TaxID=2040573 RepID=A0A916W617_9BACT|nr:GDSL-type esterase/lipase family protein [Edaphobacter acidisoli]GGA69889.1 lipase [Edaphobacter acidisoli]